MLHARRLLIPVLAWLLLPGAVCQDGMSNETVTTGGGCPDPLAAVLEILECIMIEDPVCASNGYNEGFQKLHNGVDTKTVISADQSYWTTAFQFADLTLEYDHRINVGPNEASVRYVEEVIFSDGSNFGLPPSTEYPWAQVYLQHEHALVTVDDDCRIVKWDQYGDNEEQRLVDENTDAILCKLEVFSQEECNTLFPPETEEDESFADKASDLFTRSSAEIRFSTTIVPLVATQLLVLAILVF